MPRLRLWPIVGLALSCACGGSAVRTKPAATVEAPALEHELAWLAGHWVADDGGSETWVVVGDAMLGVGLGAGGGFEAMVIDREGGGAPRFVAWPGGQQGTIFALAGVAASADPSVAEVAFLEAGGQRELTYTRQGDRLQAHFADLDAFVELAWRRGSPAPAPELEQADRDFAADTAARGADGWAAWFDPEGAMGRAGGERTVGREAIRARMAKAFANPGFSIEWRPLASGLAPGGELGFTIGASTISDGERSVRGGYVSIWRRQADGSWKVLFDTGA